ncbi:lactate/malate family dehydrogenase [Limosilactobacillus kribbianus]|uniref:lactate/malate family dehydrogenase n=1 Tax=Limosilactobacillus kribbianus TaxID=2982695 RepID=UPI0022652139|nr:L-lactate dehydrogenase [Limosilactobacillus kribbianus]
MGNKVAVIGVGHVGSTVATNIVTAGIASELMLIDEKDKVARAEAYDLTDQQAYLATTTKVSFVPYEDDWSTLADADAIVFSAGNIKIVLGNPNDHSNNRVGELANSARIVKEVGPRIKQSGFHGIMICISNPCDVIAQLMQRESGLPAQQVLGTGTSLDTARLHRAVAQTLGKSMTDVAGYVIGEHGETQFTAWSSVTVNGRAMTKIAKEQGLDLDDLQNQARLGGHVVGLGKGYTCYGIGMTALTILKSVLNDERRTFPATSLNEQLGTYIGQPTTVGAAGVIDQPQLDLTEQEEALFAKSAEAIKNNFAKVK